MAGEWNAILDKAKVSPEKRKEIEAAISGIDGLITEVEQGYMRQSDYSRKQDELRAEKQRIQDNWEKANTEYLRMQGVVEELQADSESTKKEKEEAAKKLAEAEEKLKTMPQFDPAKFISVEDFEKKQREYAAAQTAYFGDTLEIVAEHESLFKTRISPKQLIQDAIAAKKTPSEFWEEKYNVAAKRKEISDKAEETKIAEAEKRGREKYIAEQANPATRTMSPSKDPFYIPKDGDKEVTPWDDTTPKFEEDLRNELVQAVGRT